MRHLVAFETVAEERSFTRAARRLGYTQSAVSHQMATLERLVGKQLIERPKGTRGRQPDRGRRGPASPRARADQPRQARLRRPRRARRGRRRARSASARTRAPARASCRTCCARFARQFPRVRVHLTESVDDLALDPRPRGGQARRVLRDAAAARGRRSPRSSCCAIPTCCSWRPTRRSPAERDGAEPRRRSRSCR